jgi:hypothetical protein
MTKKRKTMISEVEQAELDAPPKVKETLERYRKDHERRVREMEYANNHGYGPPKPWYEE